MSLREDFSLKNFGEVFILWILWSVVLDENSSVLLSLVEIKRVWVKLKGVPEIMHSFKIS